MSIAQNMLVLLLSILRSEPSFRSYTVMINNIRLLLVSPVGCQGEEELLLM